MNVTTSPIPAEAEPLVEAVSQLRTVEEASAFMRDLLTEGELLEFSRRWSAAQMLSQSVPYSQICEETGLSTATIARISKWLSSGTGGYQMMLKRIDRSNRRKAQQHRS